jgi:hypothetical protein
LLSTGWRIMPNANYYREQARLLARWAITTTSRDVCERLMKRAHELVVQADVVEAASRRPDGTRDYPRA